jgi:hypothetical protein
MIKYLLLLLMFCKVTYAQDSSATSNTTNTKTIKTTKTSRKESRENRRSERAKLNDRYKMLSLYVTQTGLQDQRMSPLVFSGYGAALDIQTIRYSDKSYRDMQFRIMYNMSSVSVAPSSYLHYSKGDINYSYHWRIRKGSQQKIYMGGSFNNMINFRYYAALANNSVGMDLSSGLSPSVVWVKENLFAKNIVLQVKGGFSAVAFVLRYPKFVYNGTESKLLFATQFNRVFFELGLSPKLKYSKENRYYFAYVFDAYAFSSSVDGNKIRAYTNGFKFAYWIKTK